MEVSINQKEWPSQGRYIGRAPVGDPMVTSYQSHCRVYRDEIQLADFRILQTKVKLSIDSSMYQMADVANLVL